MTTIAYVLIAVALALAIFLLPGCSVNGLPMRFNPQSSGGNLPKAKSWFIEGRTANGSPISCSFVEFDERGDFLDFAQHKDCEAKIKGLVSAGPVLVLIYCHGWKNSSQSGDVAQFNCFLARLAASENVRQLGVRVHGIYLSWRGNAFRPYVDKGPDNKSYQQTLAAFGETILDEHCERRAYWTGVVPETLSYWTRKRAAEHLVSGLPMARAIFTYAATAKDYGKKIENRVCVMGHSFGALMLEKSLGQAMWGELTQEWWENPQKEAALWKPGLPFDLVLFVNSAAPAIYAKEMRDFLKAHRGALGRNHDPAQDAPVIVSITSTADWATGIVHPIGNCLAPLSPSLKRRYTTGIFGDRQGDGSYPAHRGIRQSEFYTKTPGHQPYLINHWIVKESRASLPPTPNSDTVFAANLAENTADADVFFTSRDKYPAAAWRLTTMPEGDPVTLDGLKPSMADSDYWIVSCGKELIGGHNDVWSTTTMEMYAAFFRAVETRRKAHPH